MNCSIVRDLLPLFADAVCSEESKNAVETHLASCAACRNLYEGMKQPLNTQEKNPPRYTRINVWKASLLQTALFMLSFALLTVGVTLEAATPTGTQNGLWAFALIIPATGLLLSLFGWGFLRLYRSRKAFRNSSFLLTLLFSLAALVWGCLHYGVFSAQESGRMLGLCALGIVICSAASYLLSGVFAALAGKD